MATVAVEIPDKIYFKIGEVCDIVGVQAHVLRYWETEFSILSPQKNKSGQRSYRRKDVETALRIKQLLYNEMFTIAGARKRLQSEARGGAQPQVKPEPVETGPIGPTSTDPEAPTLFDTQIPTVIAPLTDEAPVVSVEQRDALRNVAGQLLELRTLLTTPRG